MPTVLRISPFRFFFYSNENGEPAHIHIQRERMLAKFWLQPVALASSTRFLPKELRQLESLEGVHWPDVDEDLSINGLLAGSH